MERLAMYRRLSGRIPGWTRGIEAEALIQAAYDLPGPAAIVEIGAFLGSGSVLLAGARKLRRSGTVHCVDPFDASGDEHSIPHYEQILNGYRHATQVEMFRANLRAAGLANWVTTHQGSADQIGQGWNAPVDMIFMDGDQSPEGVDAAWRVWSPWLRRGGLLALHNSNPRQYAPAHDGHFRLRQRLQALDGDALVLEAGSISFFKIGAR